MFFALFMFPDDAQYSNVRHVVKLPRQLRKIRLIVASTTIKSRNTAHKAVMMIPAHCIFRVGYTGELALLCTEWASIGYLTLLVTAMKRHLSKKRWKIFDSYWLL